jgi:hypothetical protein
MNSIDMRFGAMLGMGNIAVENLGIEPGLGGEDGRNRSGELPSGYRERELI